MVHTITMDEDLTKIRLHEKGGPIENDNEYMIGGEGKETLMMKNAFYDTVEWSADGRLLLKKLRLPEKGYELWIYRSLENAGKTIKLVRCFCNNPLISISLFIYIYLSYRKRSIKISKGVKMSLRSVILIISVPRLILLSLLQRRQGRLLPLLVQQQLVLVR